MHLKLFVLFTVLLLISPAISNGSFLHKVDVRWVPGVESELNLSASKLDAHSVHEEETELILSAPKVEVMLQKLTFGSLDASPDDCKPLSVTESQQNDETTTEPCLR